MARKGCPNLPSSRALACKGMLALGPDSHLLPVPVTWDTSRPWRKVLQQPGAGGVIPEARPEQDTCKTLAEQRELGARTITVRARPAVGEIIQGSQRVKAGLDLREETRHPELEGRGAKSAGGGAALGNPSATGDRRPGRGDCPGCA